MFPRSLQWKLVGFFCLIVLCLVIPIWLFLNGSIETKYYENFTERIQEGLNSMALTNGAIDAESLNGELIDNESIFQLNLQYRSYTVTDKNGEILYTNDTEFPGNDAAALNVLLASDNYIQAMSGEADNKRYLVNYGELAFFDYAETVGDYILYFRYYKDDWAQITAPLNGIIYSSLAIGLLIAFVAGYFFSGTITVPLAKLMNKARSIADGDFGQLLEVKSKDEIGRLTQTFNYMASSMKTYIAEISSEKSKMETILNYMTDGVIAFNLKGEIIHTNPASDRFLGLDANERIENFRDYCERFGFTYCVEDVLYLDSKQPVEMTVVIGDKTLKAYFAVFTDKERVPEGVIAVLQDVTEQHRLDDMRKEFVANVSHELRTPLTSIKSYSETLLDGALEERETAERFLGVINSEANRMTRLIRDLLQLSRLDNQQMKWSFERVSLVELVRSSIDKMEMEAKSKNQTVECFVLCEIPDIEADYGRLEQVVLNILGNGMKYTPQEGKITVYIGKIHNDVYFKVADSGIGIPENDIPRIFERFYRVDKARSREMGGTGLGLAIAKDIIEAHSGVIDISSQLGVGTEVTVRLPVYQTGIAN